MDLMISAASLRLEEAGQGPDRIVLPVASTNAPASGCNNFGRDQPVGAFDQLAVLWICEKAMKPSLAAGADELLGLGDARSSRLTAGRPPGRVP